MKYSVIYIDENENCTVSNMKLDVVHYLKQGNVCKSCYNRKRRNNNNNTSRYNQESKVLMTKTIQIQTRSPRT